jgi:hypothetical protein
LPKEVRTHLSNETNINATFRSISEVKRAMEESGMTPKLISEIEGLLPMPINESENEEAHDEDAA